jgi:hypothetical protein
VIADSGGQRYGRGKTILRIDLFRVAADTTFSAGVKEAQRQGSMKEKKIRWNIRLQKKPFAGYDVTLPTS